MQYSDGNEILEGSGKKERAKRTSSTKSPDRPRLRKRSPGTTKPPKLELTWRISVSKVNQ